jgi:hypothetical protein
MAAFNQPYGLDLEEQNATVVTFHAIGAPLTGRRAGLRRADRLDLASHHVIQAQQNLATPDGVRHRLLDLIDGVDRRDRLANAARPDHVNQFA